MSGMTALIYEVVWAKYLALIFGSTIEAQTMVLAVFMGGLALGNRWMGERVAAWRRPIAIYGMIEIAVGTYGFLFDGLKEVADGLFVSWGSPLLWSPRMLLCLKGLISAGLLLPPTILMGGTLPLVASWLQQRKNSETRWIAKFYAINSLGAVIGAGLAGFWLIRAFGLSMTLWLAACVNFLVGTLALLLSRSFPMEILGQNKDFQRSDKEKEPFEISWRQTVVLVTLSGGISMGLEVLASRTLSLIFGASLQAFSVVLMAFILGISVAGWGVSSSRLKGEAARTLTLWLLMLSAGALLTWVCGMEAWVMVYRYASSGLARSEVGYVYYLLLTSGMALVSLGIPAALLGAVLPLWMRSTEGENRGMGSRVGRLMAWNTLGAVVGALTTGFLLMPRAGLRGSFAFMVILLVFAGLAISKVREKRQVILIYAGIFACLAWSLSKRNESWQNVMSSGVFRARGTDAHPRDELREREQHIKLLFYKDAPDATVSVEVGDGIATRRELSLRINGKPDASTRGDLSTQYLLAHVPMAVKPDAQNIFVLGFGSGITAGAVLGHPIKSLTIAENCRPVLEAARFFAPWNRDALKDPRVRVWREDARTVLKLNPELYDVIISEPSNPWMAGVGSVFSHEFYTLAASRLKKEGVMAQWFHIYETSDAILSLVLRTFQKTFPHVEIWDTLSGDVVLVGSRRSFDSDPSVYRKIFERPLVRMDLARIGIISPETFWARQLTSQSTTTRWIGPGPWQSDEHPLLEYDAPKAFYIGSISTSPSLWDERTRQMDSASPLKRTTLGKLSVSMVKELFVDYPSVNPELMKRIADSARLTHPEKYGSGSILPCIFDFVHSTAATRTDAKTP